MAKHKKKKSEPTPGPDNTKKKPVEEKPDDIPETEPIEKKPDDKPTEPVQTDAEKSDKTRKLNKLFWLRVGLAVIAGISATFIFDSIEGEERRWASIAYMIILFIATIVIAKGMKMQLPSSDRKKIVTQGIGSYVFLYLFTWILSYTIVNVTAVTGGITSPIP